MDIASKLNTIVNNTIDTDPEFSESIHKWKPLICSTVRKISKLTMASEEDVLNDILVPLTRLNTIKNTDQYRYKGRLYEVVKEDGEAVLLKTSEFNRIGRRLFWTDKKNVEKVKRASLDALIYNKIQQESTVIIKSSFYKKRGYVVVSSNKERMKLRNAEFGGHYRTVDKKKVKKVVEIFSLDAIESGEERINFFKDISDADYVEFKDLFFSLINSISTIAGKVLYHMCEDPHCKTSDLSKLLKCNKMTIDRAKREIRLEMNRLLGKRMKTNKCPKDSLYRTPIQLKAVYD